MRLLALICFLGLSACGNATDDLKMRQAFNIYIAGDYGLTKECDRRLSISQDRIQMAKSQCEIQTINVLEDQPGWELEISNCLSDLNRDPDKTTRSVTIFVNENDEVKISGWFKEEPRLIYKCNNKN